MGPCHSLKSTRPNKKQIENKLTPTNQDGKIDLNDYNTNNTKNININNSSNEINITQSDLKLRSTIIPNDHLKESFNTVDGSLNKQPINELDNKKKKFPFLPHVYNSLSNEDTEFYKSLIQIEQNQNLFSKSVYSLEDLKIQIKLHNKNENQMDTLSICWKIFNWIITNIKCTEYIHKENDKESEISLDSIFIHRETNSYGIAKLFKYLMDLLEIKSIIIPGYLKSNSIIHNNNFSFHGINHFWNGIEINNKLRLIDCSCANEIASNDEIKFIQFYFCAIPQHLIYTHFPLNLDHSCLKNVKVLMDLRSFEKLNMFNKFYFIYGLQLFSFKNSEINFEELIANNSNESMHLNQFMIDICLPEKIIPKFILTSQDNKDNYDLNRLVYIKKRKFNMEEDRKKFSNIDYYFYYKSYMFKSTEYENVHKYLDDLVVYELNIRLFQRGNYNLSLLARIPENSENSKIKRADGIYKFENCFDYKIFADCLDIKEYHFEDLMFPNTTELFLMKNCEIIEPMFYHLGSYFVNKKNISFTLRIPNAIDAAIFYDSEGEFVIMNKNDDCVFSFLHCIDKKFEKINIAANFGENEYVILITYEF